MEHVIALNWPTNRLITLYLTVFYGKITYRHNRIGFQPGVMICFKI